MSAETVRLPRYCPTWCLNDHQEGVNDGLEPDQCTEHRSSDFGHELFRLANPYTNEVIRSGGGGWWAQLFQPTGRDGWDSRSQIAVELRQGPDRRAVLNLEPSEALEFARALTYLAESAMTSHITPTKWAPGTL